MKSIVVVFSKRALHAEKQRLAGGVVASMGMVEGPSIDAPAMDIRHDIDSALRHRPPRRVF